MWIKELSLYCDFCSTHLFELSHSYFPSVSCPLFLFWPCVLLPDAGLSVASSLFLWTVCLSNHDYVRPLYATHTASLFFVNASFSVIRFFFVWGTSAITHNEMYSHVEKLCISSSSNCRATRTTLFQRDTSIYVLE